MLLGATNSSILHFALYFRIYQAVACFQLSRNSTRTVHTTAELYRQKATFTRYKKRTALKAVLSGKNWALQAVILPCGKHPRYIHILRLPVPPQQVFIYIKYKNKPA